MFCVMSITSFYGEEKSSAYDSSNSLYLWNHDIEIGLPGFVCL